jgi:hypothetical protein
MRNKFALCVLAALSVTGIGTTQADDPARKLGAYLGKWQSEAVMGSNKITSTAECRWSPQGTFLICEHSIKIAGDVHHQLTIYSYNSDEKTYSFVTIADPGAKPNSGKVEITANVWTYPNSYQDNGKTIQTKTTNEFTTPRSEIFKSERSDDGGATWKTILEGKAHKVGD